ncbi:hypothetical protein CB1_000193017 [Camelus ferus]|nr:hypothetical protein CB1_000193017 [Camelus ferus]
MWVLIIDWARRQEQFQRNPDSYNGAVRENYTWSQDYTDLELKVPVPKHVVKGKQEVHQGSVTPGQMDFRLRVRPGTCHRYLSVVFIFGFCLWHSSAVIMMVAVIVAAQLFWVSVVLSSSSIRVAVLEENGERVLVEGKFTHKINTESSLWSLEPGRCVLLRGRLCGSQRTVTAPPTALAPPGPAIDSLRPYTVTTEEVLVSLNKVGEYWWSAVLEGEEHIDIDKINKERSMATVDEEEHAQPSGSLASGRGGALAILWASPAPRCRPGPCALRTLPVFSLQTRQQQIGH